MGIGMGEGGISPSASPVQVAKNLGLAVDVKRDYGASGSSSSTTGTISLAAATTLTLAAAEDFANGQGIFVGGAGASGADLVTNIVSGGGTTTLTLATAATTAVAGVTVQHDDTTAMLDAAAAGTGMIVLQPGTYHFTGLSETLTNTLVYGLGAPESVVLSFPGPVVYATGSAFSGLDGVKFENLTFRAPGAELFSIFTDTVDAWWDNCIIEDCSPLFQAAGQKARYTNCRFTQSTTPPSTLQQTIGMVTEVLVVERCEFNYAFSGSSGGCVTIANNNAPPRIAIIRDNRFMDDDLPGYAVDAAIDMEPTGSVGCEHFEVTGNTIYNSKVYMSGCELGIVKDNTLVVTANGLANGIQPICLYNHFTPIPPSDSIVIEGNRILCEDNATSTDASIPISVSVCGTVTRLRIAKNDITVNGSATGSNGFGDELSKAILIANDSVIGTIDIEDNVLQATAALSNAWITYLWNGPTSGDVMVSSTNIVRNKTVGGNTNSAHYLVQFTSNTAGQTMGEVLFDANDVSQSMPADAFWGNYQISQSSILFRGNNGYNPVGSITPPASPLVSGTVYQNTSGVPITIYQPAYATTSGTAGSVAVALGSGGVPGALYTDIINAGTTASIPRTLLLRVPPGWHYSFTTTNATMLAANIQGE